MVLFRNGGGKDAGDGRRRTEVDDEVEVGFEIAKSGTGSTSTAGSRQWAADSGQRRDGATSGFWNNLE